MTEPREDAPRKPRLAIMGEFSAGKSTLTNLLLGARPLPEKVTATRLSPVWISEGTDAPYRVDVDGTEEPIALEHLEDVSVEETRVIRMFFEADILGLCDIIDFPGISDPNMDAIVWQRVLDEVDLVLWCTHATQAWRQSEAAVWESVPEEVRARSILLITRFDKLTNDRDKSRVKKRLMHETAGLFSGVFPISLTDALAAGEDYEKWEASGGAAFSEHLISAIDACIAGTQAAVAKPVAHTADVMDFTPTDPKAEIAAANAANPVVPRRVAPSAATQRARPARPQPEPDATDAPATGLGAI